MKDIQKIIEWCQNKEDEFFSKDSLLIEKNSNMFEGFHVNLNMQNEWSVEFQGFTFCRNYHQLWNYDYESEEPIEDTLNREFDKYVSFLKTLLNK